MCSGSKMKEMTGSGIFAAPGETDNPEAGSGLTNPPNKTALRMYQVCQCLVCCKYKYKQVAILTCGDQIISNDLKALQTIPRFAMTSG